MTSTFRSDPSTPRLPTISAGWIISTFAILSLAAALGSWLFYAQLQRRPLALWGSHAAALIVRGERIEALRLVPATDDDPSPLGEAHLDATLTVEGTRYRIVETREVTDRPGFSHVRHSFINDRAIDWDAPAEPAGLAWPYALRAERGQDRATWVIEPRSGRVRLVETGACASMAPVAEGLRLLLAETFSRPAH